jgi:flavin reductase (DIM6/NTAB) family NADH-FMN oxidoreductase RutF
MTSAIVPRPIAWVSTVSGEGVHNIAPFLVFQGVSTSPPIITISIASGKRGAEKDTLRNIKRSGEFSVSIVSWGNLKPMHQSSAPYPPERSEYDELDIPWLECEEVSVRRVVGAVAMECQLERTFAVGGSTLVLGRVVRWHIPDELMVGGAVDPTDLDPVARLGGGYAGIGEMVALERARVPE